jgi:hypothetical protein
VSNYTKSTNFASKDTLPSGDPLKIVKGTEIDTEFNNIATAVATKADSASPTLTGTPVAPTASAGTNTTQIATTAFVTTAVTNERTASATLTNKTLTSPVIGTIVNTGTLTLPSSTDTVVGRATTDTLTNKSVALGNNTVTGTKAQFNSAVTDTDFVFQNDLTGSNQSLSASGYQKLPGGLIMQWGNAGAMTGGQTKTITYPIAFPNAVYNVQTTNIVSTDTNEISYVYNVGTTTFVVANSNPGSLTGVYWFAIGY